VKVLVAVITCEKFKARADAQRATWAKGARGADVLFFLAKQDREPKPDEVFLDAPDDYHSLPVKVRAMHQWAGSHGYDLIFKTDDDTYVNVPNLLTALPLKDYVGFINFTPPKPWCSGFGYWTSAGASQILSAATIPNGEWAEDRWAGGVLFDHGIRPHADKPQAFSGDLMGRYVLILPPNYGMDVDYKHAVAVCDCRPRGAFTMQQLHDLSRRVDFEPLDYGP
jgi:Galactosyltransferase